MRRHLCDTQRLSCLWSALQHVLILHRRVLWRPRAMERLRSLHDRSANTKLPWLLIARVWRPLPLLLRLRLLQLRHPFRFVHRCHRKLWLRLRWQCSPPPERVS